MSLVAVEPPAEVCRWDRVGRALQCHSLAGRSSWRTDDWNVMWSNYTEKRHVQCQGSRVQTWRLLKNQEKFKILLPETFLQRSPTGSSTHSWQSGYEPQSCCWLGCWLDTGRGRGWRSPRVLWTLSGCLRRSSVCCWDGEAARPSATLGCWWSQRPHRWGWWSSGLLSGRLQGCGWWLLLSLLHLTRRRSKIWRLKCCNKVVFYKLATYDQCFHLSLNWLSCEIQIGPSSLLFQLLQLQMWSLRLLLCWLLQSQIHFNFLDGIYLQFQRI